MRLVLDSNEYISYFKGQDKSFFYLIRLGHSIFINEIIFNEVVENIGKQQVRDFIKLFDHKNLIMYEKEVSMLLKEKYQKLGLKKGDIAVAAFCEHIKTDCLISENRHFLSGINAPFKILSAEEFIKKFKL